jgi:hypothetical protein
MTTPTAPAPDARVHLVTAEDAGVNAAARETRVVDCTMDDACPYCTPETRAELARERAAARRAQVQGWLDSYADQTARDVTAERSALSLLPSGLASYGRDGDSLAVGAREAADLAAVQAISALRAALAPEEATS